jgi:hypothetical protein
MLATDPLSQHVSARLLDFFAAEAPWQRRLWDVGSCLALREVVEATRAVSDGTLSEEALRWLQRSLLPLVGPDPGLGDTARRRTAATALRARLVSGGFEVRVLEQLVDEAEGAYLKRWADHIREQGQAIAPERAARAIAGHLLSLGFSAPYLHRWWTYRVRHEPETRSLAELVEEAASRARQPPTRHSVLIPLEQATLRAHDVPEWVDAVTTAERLVALGRPSSGLAGGLIFDVIALDDGAAIEHAAREVDRYVATLLLGGGRERLVPADHAYATAPTGKPRRLPLRGTRGLELPILRRRNEPITTPVTEQIDASLELLGPVDRGAPAAAVAGAWAAVETLLTGPGDAGRIQAADRLAALIACSFPRAELTRLAYACIENPDVNPDLARTLSGLITNTAKGAALATHLSEDDLTLPDESDRAAVQRLRRLLMGGTAALHDLEDHLRRVTRRLYRVRNLVLHGAATDALTLDAALRSGVPLVGAGLDRVVRGAILQRVDPLDLAARARLCINHAANLGPDQYSDLLRLADPERPAR